MITDNGVAYNPTPIMYNNKADMAVSAGTATPPATPSLSPGQTEVDLTINVVYEIK